MAKSIFWGLSIGAILVLIVIPALFTLKTNIYQFFKKDNSAKKNKEEEKLEKEKLLEK